MEDSVERLERLLRGSYDDYEEARQLAGDLRESGMTYRHIGSIIKRALGAELDDKTVANWIGGRNPRRLMKAVRFSRRPRMTFEVRHRNVVRRADHLRMRGKQTRMEMLETMLRLYDEWLGES